MYKGGFGGGYGGGGQMQNLMKQAQKMQEQMQKAQEELEGAELVGTAGGIVSVTVDGKKNVKGVAIKPEAVDPDDVEMLEDLIMAAISDAYEKAEKLSAEKMGAFGALGGMF